VAVIVGSFAKLGKHIESFYDLLASVDKLGTLFDLPVQRHAGLIRFPQGGAARVEMRGVSYKHPHGGGLAPVTRHLASGDRLAVRGGSGTGKSTLLDLIAGRMDPTTGQLLIDDVDPRDLRPDVLHRSVAIIKRPEIFSGTLAENVHLGRPDVSVHDVRQALERVGLLEFVLHLPEGLDTPLTRSGGPLSELQQARLTLARAIVAGPRLLLIDGLLDAFADDDARQLTQEVCARRNPWTLVLVTGRQELAQLCDQALDLTAGGPTREEN
jgi:ABC-type multidrug transport system fused ATPase/permease subunit